MAKWQLKADHYLKVEGIEWEMTETSDTGVQARKRFPVPLYCLEGTIVVQGVKPAKGEIAFQGPPTPDMDPLDEEAEAITNPLKRVWDKNHPIESLGGTYADSVTEDLQRQIDRLAMQGQPISAGAISREEFDELKAMIGKLAEENKALRAGRRV